MVYLGDARLASLRNSSGRFLSFEALRTHLQHLTAARNPNAVWSAAPLGAFLSGTVGTATWVAIATVAILPVAGLIAAGACYFMARRLRAGRVITQGRAKRIAIGLLLYQIACFLATFMARPP